jgi:polyphosphate glucokinase
MKVLVVDVGGTHVKILATGEKEPRRFPSGPKLTPQQMVLRVKELARGWDYDAVSIGYPGTVVGGRPVAEPHHLGRGWVGFDFCAAFVGSYRGGKMLFLGLGTGLGSALVVDGIIEPMELGHLPYKKSNYEDYVGASALNRLGKNRWRAYVADVVAFFVAALEPDDVVLGGGNVKKLKELPAGCRGGDNANAFIGGFRLWDAASEEIVNQ